MAVFSLLPPYKEICMKNASTLIFLQIFENFRKICLFAKKKYADIFRNGGAVVTFVEKKVKSIVREKLSSTFGVTSCSVFS